MRSKVEMAWVYYIVATDVHLVERKNEEKMGG